jgi:hypothetical protein
MKGKQEDKCQRKIEQCINLCKKGGTLNPESIGWGWFPFANCNLTHHPLRKKKWNYWAITSPDAFFLQQ